MTDVRPGGRRRIDRVLAADYLAGLTEQPTGVVRARCVEAEHEHAELSYLQQQLVDRIEVVTAEQRQRAAGADPTGLGPCGDHATAAVATLGEPRRNRTFFHRTPTGHARLDRRRRRVERLVTDVDLSDVGARTDDELARVLRTYRAEEHRVTELLAQVQQVIDQCAAELTERLEARKTSAAELLDAEPAPAPGDDW